MVVTGRKRKRKRRNHRNERIREAKQRNIRDGEEERSGPEIDPNREEEEVVVVTRRRDENDERRNRNNEWKKAKICVCTIAHIISRSESIRIRFDSTLL